MCYKIFKHTSMQPLTYVYVMPRTFIQPILMITFVYFIFHFIVGADYPLHTDMMQNSIKKNLVIISSNVEVPKNKLVSFLQPIHLIDMTSKCSLPPIKRK